MRVGTDPADIREWALLPSASCPALGGFSLGLPARRMTRVILPAAGHAAATAGATGWLLPRGEQRRIFPNPSRKKATPASLFAGQIPRLLSAGNGLATPRNRDRIGSLAAKPRGLSGDEFPVFSL
jgi:hypothetical protein